MTGIFEEEKAKLFIIIFSSVQRKKTAGRLAGRLALHPQNLLREHHPRHCRRRRQVQARRPGKDVKAYLHIWPGLIFSRKCTSLLRNRTVKMDV